MKTTRVEINKKSELPGSLNVIEEISHLGVLEESGFSGVCIDEEMNVMYSFGHPGDYLKNEIFNFNLSELLPDDAAIVFTAAAHKSLQQNERILISGMQLGDTGKSHLADIIIRPYLLPEKFLLVLFTENNSKISAGSFGRPLSNLTTNIKRETLIADIKNVILYGETITKEAESADGRIYQVMTMPYVRKNDEVADGAIISFYDITELRKLLEELNISNKKLDHSNQSLLRINDDLNNFVYGASHDLNAPILNIEMVLEMLREKMDLNDLEVSNLSGMLNKTILNFKEIIKDMAALGTLESEMQNECHSEDIGLLFGEIIDTLASKIKQAR